MAIVKALRRLAGGSFGLVGATDQIACDAGAMTVTPTGGVQQSVPAAIAARVLGDAAGRVRPSKLNIGSMAANLCPNGDMEDVAGGLPVGWSLLNAVGAGSSISAFTDASYAGTTSLLLSKATATTSSAVAALGPRMDVTPLALHGLGFYVAPMAGTTTSGFTVQAFWYDRTDTYVTASNLLDNGPIAGAWNEISLPATPPAGCTYGRLAFILAEASTAQYVGIDAVLFRPALGALGIRDAAITPTKLYAPTRGQFFRALENSAAGRVATVTDAVPSDRGDAINIAFAHAQFVTQSGVLAQFVKTTLGLTDAQLAAIIAAARSVTE
ncbi:protein of unknown function [Methylorubrum extorquens]|uniref:Uncharacterized protein n=1 Tax=Methylorubrum extorquens TaxID=408 RepID=A0A2N9AID0_METEX|nr:protein of unknown function [Methylorubrum extorquens]